MVSYKVAATGKRESKLASPIIRFFLKLFDDWYWSFFRIAGGLFRGTVVRGANAFLEVRGSSISTGRYGIGVTVKEPAVNGGLVLETKPAVAPRRSYGGRSPPPEFLSGSEYSSGEAPLALRRSYGGIPV
jgi:hypothetical protein